MVGGKVESQCGRKTFGVDDPSFQFQCATADAETRSAGEPQLQGFAEVDQKAFFTDVFRGADKDFIACMELDRKAEVDTGRAIREEMIQVSQTIHGVVGKTGLL